MKKAIFFALMVLAGNALGYQTSVPTQITGVNWTVSGATGLEPVAYCSSLTVNLVTDFVRSTMFTVSGVLNCNSGAIGYASWGAGYLNNLGGISFTISIAGQYSFVCQTNSTFNATCRTLSNAGFTIATPSLTFY